MDDQTAQHWILFWTGQTVLERQKPVWTGFNSSVWELFDWPCLKFISVYVLFSGVFLVPYLFFAIMLGIPMFLLETLIGQYTQEGAISCWTKICPLAKGTKALSKYFHHHWWWRWWWCQSHTHTETIVILLSSRYCKIKKCCVLFSVTQLAKCFGPQEQATPSLWSSCTPGSTSWSWPGPSFICSTVSGALYRGPPVTTPGTQVSRVMTPGGHKGTTPQIFISISIFTSWGWIFDEDVFSSSDRCFDLSPANWTEIHASNQTFNLTSVPLTRSSASEFWEWVEGCCCFVFFLNFLFISY